LELSECIFSKSLLLNEFIVFSISDRKDPEPWVSGVEFSEVKGPYIDKREGQGKLQPVAVVY
jgi:hypothetical protein